MNRIAYKIEDIWINPAVLLADELQRAAYQIWLTGDVFEEKRPDGVERFSKRIDSEDAIYAVHPVADSPLRPMVFATYTAALARLAEVTKLPVGIDRDFTITKLGRSA